MPRFSHPTAGRTARRMIRCLSVYMRHACSVVLARCCCRRSPCAAWPCRPARHRSGAARQTAAWAAGCSGRPRCGTFEPGKAGRGAAAFSVCPKKVSPTHGGAAAAPRAAPRRQPPPRAPPLTGLRAPMQRHVDPHTARGQRRGAVEPGAPYTKAAAARGASAHHGSPCFGMAR